MDSLTGDLGVFVFGISMTILFISGYLFTIKEFNEMEDQRQDKEEESIRVVDN